MHRKVIKNFIKTVSVIFLAVRSDYIELKFSFFCLTIIFVPTHLELLEIKSTNNLSCRNDKPKLLLQLLICIWTTETEKN